MFEIQGKYSSAKVFIEYVEEKAMKQLIELTNNVITQDCKIAIMPDVHAGSGCTIGSVFEVKDKIHPNLIGVDIGCGVFAVEFTSNSLHIDVLKELDLRVRENIPSGTSSHHELNQIDKQILQKTKYILGKTANRLKMNESEVEKHLLNLGTLGGGNHFIEIGKVVNSDKYFLFVHSGSRNLGVKVCQHYVKLIEERRKKEIKAELNGRKNEIIAKLKEQGKQEQIQAYLAHFKNELIDLAKKDYLDGKDVDDYLEDMQVAQTYAALNRQLIAFSVLKELASIIHIELGDMFDTVHNYIDKHRIARKGAVEATTHQKFVIPINMRDGVLICKGDDSKEDYEEWLRSAPHGAGRVLSRSEAKKELSLSAFEANMCGIVTSSVKESTLDEAPGAYKPLSVIQTSLGNHIQILEKATPIWNFKAI